MTWLRGLTFLLGSQIVILIVLFFWISSFLLMLVFVLQWLSLNWEILIMVLSHFHWFSIRLTTGCTVLLLWLFSSWLAQTSWSFERCSMGGYVVCKRVPAPPIFQDTHPLTQLAPLSKIFVCPPLCSAPPPFKEAWRGIASHPARAPQYTPRIILGALLLRILHLKIPRLVFVFNLVLVLHVAPPPPQKKCFIISHFEITFLLLSKLVLSLAPWKW